MHSFVDHVLTALAVVSLIPCTFLFVQLVAAWAARSETREAGFPATDASVAVLMPAHDEEAGIGASIRSVLDQLRSGDRLLVVADNCSDGTAVLARSLGAEVVERDDLALRGKGYALDFGVRELARRPPAVVVVVDADCLLAPGSLAALAGACTATGRPVQGLYLMHATHAAPLGMRVAAFAWLVKNKLRPMGASHLGWPCQLMGTGMAFRWATLEQASLASGHLVEDMQLGLELAAAGTPPLFCRAAVVSSVFPTDQAGAASQRARWEHGHLSIIASELPRLLWRAARRRDARLLAMALDLAVPPLASLVLMLATLAAAAVLWWSLGGRPLAMLLTANSWALLGSAIALAWHQEGRRCVSAAELAYLPVYVATKIPMYVRLFTKRKTQWIRTKRDASQS